MTSNTSIEPQILDATLFLAFLTKKCAEIGSQNRLAKHIGVSQAAIHKFLVVGTTPSLEMVFRVCRAFNVSPTTFINLSGFEICASFNPGAIAPTETSAPQETLSTGRFLGYYALDDTYALLKYDTKGRKWQLLANSTPVAPPDIWGLLPTAPPLPASHRG